MGLHASMGLKAPGGKLGSVWFRDGPRQTHAKPKSRTTRRTAVFDSASVFPVVGLHKLDAACADVRAGVVELLAWFCILRFIRKVLKKTLISRTWVACWALINVYVPERCL